MPPEASLSAPESIIRTSLWIPPCDRPGYHCILPLCLARGALKRGLPGERSMAGPSLSVQQQQRQMMILAPQLRQSLEMLQLPLLELRTVLRQEMERNPTIEDVTDPQEISVDAEQPVATAEDRVENPLDFDKEFDALTKLDEEWRDYFLQGMENAPSSEDADERRQFLLDSVRQPESLQVADRRQSASPIGG